MDEHHRWNSRFIQYLGASYTSYSDIFRSNDRHFSNCLNEEEKYTFVIDTCLTRKFLCIPIQRWVIETRHQNYFNSNGVIATGTCGLAKDINSQLNNNNETCKCKWGLAPFNVFVDTWTSLQKSITFNHSRWGIHKQKFCIS